MTHTLKAAGGLAAATLALALSISCASSPLATQVRYCSEAFAIVPSTANEPFVSATAIAKSLPTSNAPPPDRLWPAHFFVPRSWALPRCCVLNG
jgi:hypothetical protein